MRLPVGGSPRFQCRTQHDVCWDSALKNGRHYHIGFNAARSMMCVGTKNVMIKHLATVRFQCRTQHDVCWDFFDTFSGSKASKFQCRTQHDVCWDSVVPSPCPTRAVKAFWKVIRFSRCFCRQNAFFGRKIVWQIVSIPYPARIAPFWKDAAEERGLCVPVDHFPFYFALSNIHFIICAHLRQEAMPHQLHTKSVTLA